MNARVSLLGQLQIPEAFLAGMLLAQTLLGRGLNSLAYAGTTAAETVSERGRVTQKR